MESVTPCRQRLQALRCLIAKQSDALAALAEVFAQEAEHLRRHDQARCLRDLRSEVIREVDHIQRAEADAAYMFDKVMFISGLAKFAFGALGATMAGSSEAPLSVGTRLARGDFERTQPYSTVLVAVGPGGVPDGVHVVPVSRSARESDRSEAEIEAELRHQGHFLMTPQTFSKLVDELEVKVLKGILALPVASAGLIPKRADGGSEGFADTAQSARPALAKVVACAGVISKSNAE